MYVNAHSQHCGKPESMPLVHLLLSGTHLKGRILSGPAASFFNKSCSLVLRVAWLSEDCGMEQPLPMRAAHAVD